MEGKHRNNDFYLSISQSLHSSFSTVPGFQALQAQIELLDPNP